MIKYTVGDVLAADAEALVNTVNCVGVMGRGIALEFKKAFPANFKAYKWACDRGEVLPGYMFIFETGQLTSPRYIVNFPTKRHWRGKSRLSDIELGLKDLVSVIKSRGIRSVAVPPLGSGLGGLNWLDVRELIEHALGELSDVDICVYEPRHQVEPARAAESQEVPAMTPGRAALVGLMNRYLAGLMDPFVTLLEVHKLMYFMQEAGEPLRLRYTQAPYGPYAENLRHVLRAIEGYLVSGYTDTADAPEMELSLIPGAVADATQFIEGHLATNARFERVADLVRGFETPFGLELLSTVHWVVSRGKVDSADDVVERTYSWGERKRQFQRVQIHLALDVLSKKGWLPSTSESITA